MTREPGSVFERDGELHVMTNVGTTVQITNRRRENAEGISGSDNYATQILDAWELSPQVSAAIGPHIPNQKDTLAELRRRVPALVELLPDSMPGRMFIDCNEELFKRAKFYMQAFMPRETVNKTCDTIDVDSVRRSWFDAVRLLGEHLTKLVEATRSRLGRADEPIVVRFAGEAPVRLLNGHRADAAFAAFDPCSDRVCMRLASYFCVTSAHDRDWAAEYNRSVAGRR